MVKEIQITGYQCERDSCDMIFAPELEPGLTIEDTKSDAINHEQRDTLHVDYRMVDNSSKDWEVVLHKIGEEEILGIYSTQISAKLAIINYQASKKEALNG